MLKKDEDKKRRKIEVAEQNTDNNKINKQKIDDKHTHTSAGTHIFE